MTYPRIRQNIVDTKKINNSINNKQRVRKSMQSVFKLIRIN